MFNNLGITELLVFGIAAIVIIFIITRVARFFFRIILFVAVIAALFYFISGKTVGSLFTTPTLESLFEKTTLNGLYNTTCNGGTASDAKCACIVNVVYNDIKTRYTDLGLQELDDNKMMMLVEVRKSIKTHSSEMEACLKQRGNEGLKFLNMLQNMFKPTTQTSK